MGFFRILLILILAVIGLVGVSTAACAVIGRNYENTEQWVRNGFVISLGFCFIAMVVWGAIWCVKALDRIQQTDLSFVEQSREQEPVVSQVYRGPEEEATAHYTPPSGTVIRPEEEPERITGQNYGEDYVIEETFDYVTLADNADVRKGPGEDFERIGSIPAGATIARRGKYEGWSLINYNGNYGFVSDTNIQ